MFQIGCGWTCLNRGTAMGRILIGHVQLEGALRKAQHEPVAPQFAT